MWPCQSQGTATHERDGVAVPRHKTPPSARTLTRAESGWAYGDMDESESSDPLPKAGARPGLQVAPKANLRSRRDRGFEKSDLFSRQIEEAIDNGIDLALGGRDVVGQRSDPHRIVGEIGFPVATLAQRNLDVKGIFDSRSESGEVESIPSIKLARKCPLTGRGQVENSATDMHQSRPEQLRPPRSIRGSARRERCSIPASQARRSDADIDRCRPSSGVATSLVLPRIAMSRSASKPARSAWERGVPVRPLAATALSRRTEAHVSPRRGGTGRRAPNQLVNLTNGAPGW